MPAATTTTARMTRERFMACPPSALHGRRRGRQRRRCRWLLRHCLLQLGQRQVGHDDDRKRGVEGTSGAVRVGHGGRRTHNKTKERIEKEKRDDSEDQNQ